MAIRKTESRIPEGYTPHDLGEANWPNEGDFSLISSLSSPIAWGYQIDYAVFVNDNDSYGIDRIHWRVYREYFPPLASLPLDTPVEEISSMPDPVIEQPGIDGKTYIWFGKNSATSRAKVQVALSLTT